MSLPTSDPIPPVPARLYRAACVFPVDQPPLRNGVVEVRGEEILAVRTYRAGDEAIDLGDVALLPGLVNPHTHLEFGRLESPLGECGMPFPDWIRRIRSYRLAEEERTGDPAQWRIEGVAQGLAESHRAGVAALGEIATTPWPEEVFAQAPLDCTVFLELLGLMPERIEPLWEMVKQHVAAAEMVTARWLAGISPHAPYSVHPELLRRICRHSAEEHFPVAFHVAESVEEIELLLSGSGSMVDLLESVNYFPRAVIPRGARPLDYLQILAEAERSLVIHGNFLSGEEIAFLGERSERMSVVYCPRTHAYFCKGPYPLADMLAANVNVCLATDSRASSPDLRMFEELRFVSQRHGQVTLDGVLYLGTQAGADALGIGDEYGSITPGKSAHLTLVTLTTTNANDPHELLFAEGTEARPLDFDALC